MATVWTWIVRKEVGRGAYRTRWKLSEEDARATFGDRLIERVELTREERGRGNAQIQPGYMSKRKDV